MKINFKGLLNSAKTLIGSHAPEILTGIGITGMISTTIMAVAATPKAIKLCEKVKDQKDNPTKLDYVKATWKCYAPSVVTCGLSTACLIGANSVNHRRNAALATAYKLSETALCEYKNKVVEVIGEEREREIENSIAKDKIDRNPPTKEIYVTDTDEHRCYDVISGRYFRSSINKLQKVANDLNRRMRDDMYISLNEFYLEIGLPETSQGDDIGWNINRGYIDLSFSSQIAEDDAPCIVVYYKLEPKYDYSRI